MALLSFMILLEPTVKWQTHYVMNFLL
jgi:hypothetical protein